jgi:ketosteroid isomerase-like protein
VSGGGPTDAHETIALAYERWGAGDLDGFLDLFDDDAVFVVPGRTPLSGDHDKAAFRSVLDRVAEATRVGRHRQELVCTYQGDSGTALVFDTYFGPDETDKYHSVHEWIFKEGRPHVWMLYVHEYDLFARLWQ